MLKVPSNTVRTLTDAESGLIDYDKLREKVKDSRPNLIVSGASYYPREISFKSIGEIAKEFGAIHLADISHISGLVIAGLHESPIPYSDVTTMTTHKMLRGPRGALILSGKDYNEKLDDAIFPLTQGSCHMHQILSVYQAIKEASSIKYKSYINTAASYAKYFADALLKSRVKVVTEGTDTTMVVFETSNAVEFSLLLAESGILANPVQYNGSENFIRIGTNAISSRKLSQLDVEIISEILISLLRGERDLLLYKKKIKEICAMRPIPKAY